MIGTTISHYRITAKLGKGGMGEVYRAQDVRLGRDVALKLLSRQSEAEDDPRDPLQFTASTKQRFLQEARVISTLSHPGIVTVYDVGESEGRLFIVMELVEGETLRTHIDRGRMELKHLLRMALTLAEALTKAHAAGVVHRDIKPENIMLATDGQTKLLDFGIAKLRRTPVDAKAETVGATQGSQAMTTPGTLLGTIYYMSPEQVLGKEIDHRSDLFSMGSVLYECLCLRRPFEGSTVDVMYDIAHTAPPPLAENEEEGPRELRNLVEKLMEKDRDDRYQNAADVAVDLRRMERRSMATTTASAILPLQIATRAPDKSTPRWLAPALAAALVVGVLTGALAVRGWWPGVRAPAAAQVFPVTHARKSIAHPAFSPDGRLLAFVGEDKQIFVALAAGGDTNQITRTPGEKAFPRFSRDGSRILFTSFTNGADSDLWEVSALGGAPHRVLTGAAYGTWSADGSRLAFTRMQGGKSRDLYAADANGQNPRRLAEVEGMPAGLYPAWTPDGRRLVYLEAFQYLRTPALRIVSADGGAPITLVSEGLISTPPAVSPDGLWVYYAAVKNDIVDLWRTSIKGGSPEQATFSAGEDHSPAFGPDGQLYFVTAHHHSKLHFIDEHGERKILDETLISSAQISRDGRRVAFIRPARSGTTLGEIMLLSADGSNLQRLDSPGLVLSVVWSRDGKLLGYSSRNSGRMKAGVLEVETGKQWPLIGPPDLDTFLADFSPSGELLLKQQKGSFASSEVLVYNPATGQQRSLVKNMVPLGWSNDGKWIASLKSEGNGGVFLIPSEGGEPRRIYEGNFFQGAFHPGKSEVIVLTRVDLPQFVSIAIQDGKGGTPQPWYSPVLLSALTQFGAQALQYFDPAGRALVVVNEADMDIFRMRVPN